MESLQVLAGFAACDFLTPARVAALRGYFGSLEAAWQATEIHDFEMAGLSARSAESFCRKKREVESEKVLAAIEKCGARVVFFEDDDYPKSLLTIDSPPAILLIKGEILPQDAVALAVVGTRRVSPAGKRMTEKLVPELVRSGLTIVSGLARGVDAIAHKAALDVSGRTLAVLGNGIDSIYPPENERLSERIIAEGGAIISEFCPGVPPNAFHFPRRNRLVAGMSMGTLVIEGAEKSGSLITAQFALEQGREVFALPGSPVSALAAGPNRLIQKGEAKLVLTAEDILNELPIRLTASQEEVRRSLPHDPVELSVFELLDDEPRLFDEIVRKSGFSPAQFSATLTILEMKGFAASYGGNRWARK